MGVAERGCTIRSHVIRSARPGGYIVLVKSFTLGCLMVVLFAAQLGLAVPAWSFDQLGLITLVQAKPSSNQGKLAQAKPSSNQGKLAQAKPSSNQGKLVQAKPSSNQGKLAQAKPFSSQGKLAQAKPFSSQGKLVEFIDDVARVRSMYQEVRAIYREAARMLSGAKGYDQRKPIIVLQRHCSRSLGKLSGKLKEITLRRADPAIVAAAKRDHNNCRKRFDKLS